MILGRMVARRARKTMSFFACALLLTVVAVGGSAAVVRADWPQVIDQAPADAQVIVAIHSLDAFSEDVNEFMTAIGAAQLGAAAAPKPEDLLMELGVDPTTINAEASLGLVVVKNRWMEDLPPVMLLLPVKDYAAFLESLGATTEGELSSFTAANSGDTIFAKQSGDYAVLSMDQEIVTGYKPAENAGRRLKSLLGDAGSNVADKSGVVVVVDPEGLAGVIGPALKGVMSQQLAMMAGMPGQDPNAAKQQAAMMEAMLMTGLRSAKGLALRLGADKDGVMADLAVNWKEESEMASFFPGSDDATNLLTNFADNPYILAISSDLRGVRVGEMLDSMQTMMEETLASIQQGNEENAGEDVEDADESGAGDAPEGEDVAADDAIEKFDVWMRIWEEAEGVGFVTYPSPAGMMAGVFSNSVYYFAGDTEEIQGQLRSAIESFNGETVQQLTYTTSYTEGAAEIGGVTADQFQMRMQAGAANPEIQQMLGMLYGPTGIRGYIVPTEDGVIQTLSLNKLLVNGTLAAIEGDDDLESNAMIQAVTELLPTDSSIRMFISLGGISAMVGPMVGMMAPNVNLEPLATAPPIGAAIDIDRGAVLGSLVVPAPLIKTSMEIAMQAMMGQPGPAEEEEEPLF